MMREQFYDRLRKKLDFFLKQLNICDWHNGLHGSECIRYYNPCCESGGVCQYLSSAGCTVKSLSCKLYLCPEAQSALQRIIIDKTHPQRTTAVQFLSFRLQALGWCDKYNILLKPRATKEETFSDNNIPELSKEWDWLNQEFPLTSDLDLSTYEINATCQPLT